MDGKVCENRIREQELLLESIYNTIECGVIRYVRIDETEYEVLSMNQAALDMLDYESMQECIDDGFYGVTGHVIEKDKLKVISLTKSLKNVGDMVKFEYQVKGKKGDDRWILAHSHFLKQDEKNRPVIQRTMTDITEKKMLELQLSQEREMYQIALENSADVLYEYDMQKDCLVMYMPYTDDHGTRHTRRQIIADYRNKVVAGEVVRREDVSKLKKLLFNEIEESMEIQLKIDGIPRWYQVSGKKVFENGEEVRIVGTMHDIHDIKAVQKENQNNLQELKINRLAIESLSSYYTGIHFVNLRANTYYALRIPEHLRSLVPKRGEYTEVIEHYIQTQIVYEDREKVRKFVDPEYLMQNMNSREKHIEIEYRCIRTEGNKPVWNRVEINLVSCKDEVPEFITINFLDITGEKREALSRQYDNAILGYAISDSYDAIYEIGLDHDTVYRVLFDGKQIYRKKYEQHYTETVQENIENKIHPDSKEAYLAMMSLEHMRQNAGEALAEDYCEALIRPEADEDYRWVAFTLRSAVRDNSKRVLMFTKNVDARRRKELEYLEQEQKSREAIMEAYEAANRANEAKSQFLSRMSHDIRTPLNAIIGMTAIAGTHIEDAERVRDCLSKISSSGKLLLNLINEVLDMSKVENGNISLNEEEFNLSDIVQDMMEVVKTNLASKSQEMKVNISSLQHEEVIGDTLRLQQVFMNLLSNAIKYTPEGGTVTLHISEKPSNVNSVGCYEFVFEDTGIGMDPEFIPKIFEPFERAEDSRVSKIQGTGLGMAITQSIVRMMNGTIQVESELNRGTRITVTIFLKLPEREIETIAELEDLSILVVDDDPDTCEYTCIMLKNIGMRGESVYSGAAAIQKVEKAHLEGEDYFAVIIDWKMPEIDGIETTRAIRNLIGPDIPVIILSAYDWSEIETEAREAGVNGFIAKPLFRSRLVYTLKKFLPGAEEESAVNEMDLDHISLAEKRILLVEDNELNREIAMEIIGITGVSIDTAENGKEAVELVSSAPEGYYDLIFMDIQMPVMNGYDATRSIRALEKKRTVRIPVIAMTANAFIEDIQMSKEAGMDAHLAKPLDFGQLTNILKKWLISQEN
ncbi:MAG: response regulator [Lachnospiraceae bacterium]|nr:response regulator [Lachnospiraceae bacterium]